jgi:ribosomal protein S18 acetylase RimI-like enzyme
VALPATPALHVRPLRADEYPEWQTRSRSRYAEDLVRHAGMRRPHAVAKAGADFATLLPQGAATPGHDVYVLEDETRGEVGHLWLAERELDGEPVVYVYEIEIAEHARGRGLGRAAMRLAEEETRRRGRATVALNVFGENAVARSLYRSLGYAEVAVAMRKRLDEDAEPLT